MSSLPSPADALRPRVDNTILVHYSALILTPIHFQMMCRAMYDYTAADSDEVSFTDGDIIIECQPVDAGWMTGRVERTGQYGMLPSNYVERIN